MPFTSSSAFKKKKLSKQQSGTLKVRTITTAITTQPVKSTRLDNLFKVLAIVLLFGVLWEVSDWDIDSVYYVCKWNWNWLKAVVKGVIGTGCGSQ